MLITVFSSTLGEAQHVLNSAVNIEFSGLIHGSSELFAPG
jgi:hypothetical protein